MDKAIIMRLNQLNMEIAILQYDLKISVCSGTPIQHLDMAFRKLGILQIQRQHLRTGRYNELPYPVQFLYLEEKNRNIVVNDAVHLDEFTGY